MIEQLEKRTVSKSDQGLGLLIRATGGFAGLVRAGFHHADKLQQIPTQDYHKAIGWRLTVWSQKPMYRPNAERCCAG